MNPITPTYPNTAKLYNLIKQIAPPKPVVRHTTNPPVWAYAISGVVWLGVATGIMMLGRK